jgi:hypothetical protein
MKTHDLDYVISKVCHCVIHLESILKYHHQIIMKMYSIYIAYVNFSPTLFQTVWSSYFLFIKKNTVHSFMFDEDYTNEALTIRSRLTRSLWFHTLCHVYFFILHFKFCDYRVWSENVEKSSKVKPMAPINLSLLTLLSCLKSSGRPSDLVWLLLASLKKKKWKRPWLAILLLFCFAQEDLRENYIIYIYIPRVS